MAIQPIDLQTLFTQLEKVGKNQAAQKDGLAIQQALQGIHIQKKTEEHIQSINEAQNTGEGAEGIKDREGRKKAGHEPADKEGAGENEEKPRPGEKAVSVFRDPALGRNLDVSG